MSGHFVASEGSQLNEWKARGGGKYPQREWHEVPTGVCHAVKQGEEHTACGITVAELVALEGKPWGRGIGHDWCRACEAVVPL